MNEFFSSVMTVLSSGIVTSVLQAVLSAVVGCIVIQVVVSVVAKALAKSKLEKAAHSLILSIVRVALYVLLGLSIASALGIDVTGVVALASVLTLAVSLALQNMMSNVMGGFTILSTHPFKSGDYVDIGGTAGTVEEITMTYTRLATVDNKIVSIPNSSVVGSQITNFSCAGTRRVDVDVSASYNADPQQVIDALVKAGTVEKAMAEPAPFAALTGYGESTINYTLRVWCKAEDYWDVFFQVNQRVIACFKESGVEMSYPHVNVHMN